MDINKLFAELGRMHLHIMQLQEELALAQAKVAELSKLAQAPAEQKD